MPRRVRLSPPPIAHTARLADLSPVLVVLVVVMLGTPLVLVLSSLGTGTWARSTFREHRSNSWNKDMMEHRSKHRWNVIHATGTIRGHLWQSEAARRI